MLRHVLYLPVLNFSLLSGETIPKSIQKREHLMLRRLYPYLRTYRKKRSDGPQSFSQRLSSE